MALITGALVWRWSRAHVRSEPRTLAAMRTVPLTTLTGEEDWPSFSPDGDQVAFEWRGEKGDNADIYVAMVGSSEVRRLTAPIPHMTLPQAGRPMAVRSLFCERTQKGSQIHLIAPLGRF